MKNKTVMVSILAFFAIIFALNMVSADIATITEVTVNGITADPVSPIVAGYVSDTVPVEVEFVADEDVEDVRVKVYIEGYRDEVTVSTDRFKIVNGSKYIKRFSIKLPSSMDLDDTDEVLDLQVRITAKGEDSVEESYAIRMQRELYGLSLLSVEAPQQITPGSVIAVDVVLQNNGFERLDNTYVIASIPDLGVEKKIYFGDIDSDIEEDYDDIRDTMNKKIYLSIPRNVIPGVYDLEVKAYNYDASVSVTKQITIGGDNTGVLPVMTSKSISTGEEATFEIVLVNPNDRMVVYSITPEESIGLLINAETPVVAIGADSSKTVKIIVKATDSAEEGTHIVTINVNSESGLVEQIDLTVNVEDSATANSAVLILTVVLAIIFVVLLIILIVLLTKKPAEPEEFGETSYY